MFEQHSFPGFDDVPPTPPPPPASEKTGGGGPKDKAPFSVFFSFFLANQQARDVAEMTARLKQEHGLTGKPLLPHRLHITLMDLGNYQLVPEELIAAAKAAADSLTWSAFDLVLDSAMSYSSNTYVLVGQDEALEPVKAFREALREAVVAQGLRAGKSFSPHLTLMYDPARIARHPVEPVRLQVQEFVLIRSHVGKGIYDLLGRWPLRA